MKLTELTWPEVEKIKRDIVVIYPIAALEQHGPHLPFFVDSILCGAVADAVEENLRKDVLMLPVQWLGASAHHLGMPGSLSAELDTHVKMICEPLRCLLNHGFDNIFVLNGHGGNIITYQMALRQLATEYPKVRLRGASYWEIAWNSMASMLTGPLKQVGHACEAEAALMMAVRPDLVRKNKLVNDPPPNDPSLDGVFIPLDTKRQSLYGAEGYAKFATAAQGKRMLKQIIKEVTDAVRAMRGGATRKKGTKKKTKGTGRRKTW